MTIGFYGLFFEMSNPGSLIPGMFGAIALILGLYALSVLPVSIAGAALIVLGLALMIAEAVSPSFGVMGVGGVAAFGLGATFLIDTDAPGFTLSWTVIITTTALTGLFVLAIAGFALNAQRRTVVTGSQHLLEQTGHVIEWNGVERLDHGHGRSVGKPLAIRPSNLDKTYVLLKSPDSPSWSNPSKRPQKGSPHV